MRYPSNLNKEPRTGIWYNSETNNDKNVALHSKNARKESTKFRHRTRLSGDLGDSDCSLVIDDVTLQDAGPYFFRVNFGGGDRFNYHPPVTQLHVTDFTDKPRIFSAEMVAGHPVNVTCSFNTTFNGTTPTLTWVTRTGEPSSASHRVTQWGDTWTYTSVLSLTPALKHHGQNLTCRVTYPTVSSSQILTLNVQYAPQNLSITSPRQREQFLGQCKGRKLCSDPLLSPEFANIYSWVSVKEGNSAAILCSVQSLPTSNLTWRHLGVTLNTTRSSNKLWMEFPQLTRQDAGVYQCVAENEHGTVERDVTLTVECE
ncbi:LOW QUALITY PROTEIN: sialic acid-binding Ig-like lectin 12 [Leucoraja erinacea]|uniref:LOW QUALITY PROTEIN: sialic acid-binding Ig-like lectin 12 n=1 Tax=Leucoraja erinaceus TaxID=7782 RepID=UPI0024565510|nr:LOW QUALITY PROTEIN: sialic acid-binding Ig-like lectin 12 [Leucoraja erinacea]